MFPDNQWDNIAFRRIFDEAFESEVRDLLKLHLCYTVAVDVYAFDGKSRKELGNIRQDLLIWLRASIPQLFESEDFPQTSVLAGPPKVPVRVRLACWALLAGVAAAIGASLCCVVRKALSHVDGVTESTVDMNAHTATVTFDSSRTNP
jgi:hypothetical protein